MISEDVYNLLKTRTDETRKTLAELHAVDEDIKSGRYLQKVVDDELYPKRNELRKQLENAIEAAGSDARKIVSDYQEKLREEDSLNPAELNDDVKLLSAGITLLPRDINAMLNRNKENRTMTQLILRFAKEHDIDTGVHYVGNQAEIAAASGLLSIIDLYTRNWMRTTSAAEMLDKFFSL